MSVVEVPKKPMMAMSHAWKIADSLDKDSVMVEWGGGASTFFWLKSTPVSKLVTIEHDRDWYRGLVAKKETLEKDYGSRLELMHIPKQVTESLRHHEFPGGAEEYASPDEFVPIDRADVILVDGINRNLCLAFAAARAKKGARIFLHDSEDVLYAWELRHMRGHPDWSECFSECRGLPEEEYNDCELACWERIG